MALYPAYKKYKPTRCAWLKEIPEHWEYKRIKNVASHNDEALDERTEPDLEIEYVDISSVSLINGIEKTESMPFEKAPSRARRKVKDGDIIVSTVRTYLKAIAPICEPPENMVVSTGFAVVRPRENLFSGFAGYLLQSNGFVGDVVANSVGVSYPAINASDLVRIPAVEPPLDEQQAIARFLDFKTAQIDALIAKKKELLDKLAEKRTALISHAVTKGLDPSVPMKDSRVDWIGEIPKHWDVWKVTHGFRRIGSGTTPKSDNPTFYDGTIPWVTTSELRESIIFDTVQKVTEEAVASHSALKIYPAGSLAIAMYGATIGRLGMLGINATFNQACCVFSDPEVFDSRFVYYWLWMRRPILISLSNGGGQPNLSQDDLKKIWIPIPDLDEQKEIVRYLDKKTFEVDEHAMKVEEAVTKLLEYRSSLITNAVTGKIDVRDIETPQLAEGIAS